MTQSLGEALPEAIAKVSEWIGQQEAQAKEMDDLMPGAGDGIRFMAKVVRVKRDMALAAQQSGDVIAMLAAYQEIKPALGNYILDVGPEPPYSGLDRPAHSVSPEMEGRRG